MKLKLLLLSTVVAMFAAGCQTTEQQSPPSMSKKMDTSANQEADDPMTEPGSEEDEDEVEPQEDVQPEPEPVVSATISLTIPPPDQSPPSMDTNETAPIPAPPDPEE